MTAKGAGVVLAICVLLVLHQDFWNWRTAYPMVFGFLPIGLAYHAFFSLVTAGLCALLVRHVWPEHLEHDAGETETRR